MNKPKCLSCKAIIRRVQSLLEEIRSIRRIEAYAICDHCQYTGVQCKRCQHILSQFKSELKVEIEKQQQDFKQWLNKVKQLLEAILSGGQLCKYGMYQKTDDVVELEKLLEELCTTKDFRQPEVNAFPSAEELTQSKDMVREVIRKFRVEGTRRYSSDDSLYVSLSNTYGGDCICKIFKDRAMSIKTSIEVMKQLSASKVFLDKAMGQAQSQGVILKDTKRNESKQVAVQNNINVKEKKVPGKRPKADKDSEAVKVLFDDSTKKREKKYPKKDIKARTTPRKVNKKTVTVEYQKKKLFEAASFENIFECQDKTKSAPREMIRGMEIIPFDKDYLGKRDAANALFFHSNFEFESKDTPILVITPVMSESSFKSSVKSTKSLHIKKNVHENIVEDRSGVILYELSNRKFIDNGWTQLPTTKTLRRMNIYKMQPADSCDWFGRYKGKGTMYYGTGEKVAEINKDGSGFWFYKNGLVALEHYDIPDSILTKRVTVLSNEVDKSKDPKSQNVLACFDYSGNGIVYDNKGNQRLKYNQSEGYIFDSNVGTPGRWKWHALNDPPVYRQIYVEETLKTISPELEKLMQYDTEKHRETIVDDAMVAIELQHIAKENVAKLTKKYKAFDIRIKALKINDYFSLKVNDQANVYLLYRDGPLAMKLNLGMILQNEIIAMEDHDTFAVTTPYDQSPPKPRCLDQESPILNNFHPSLYL